MQLSKLAVYIEDTMAACVIMGLIDSPKSHI